MRFSCDSCGAQYMISDDKVGPGGVKVRCKRCGQVVLVKPAPAEAPVVEPAPEAPAAAPPEPSAEANRSAETGLDAELGQAFENVFGGGSMAGAGAPGEGSPTEAPGAQAPSTASAPPAPAAEVEWYAAIDDAQVGPLLAAGLKARWEAGEVGPDTLVWSAGMADWTALSNVPELAQALAPVPRPQAARGAAPRAPEPAPEPTRAPAAEAPAPASETGWKPTGASALAALANEELQAMAKPEPERSAPAPGSIVDRMGLPEGGVDPTGMIPLHLRGVETTGETLLDARPPREEKEKRESTEVRELRKSSSRNLWVAVAAMAVAVGGAGAWVASEFLMKPKPAPVAAAPAPVPAPAPVAAPAPAPAPAAAPAPGPAPDGTATAPGTTATPAVAAPTATPTGTSAATAPGTTPAAAPAVTPAPPPAEVAQAPEPPPEKPAPARPAKKEAPAKASKAAKTAKATRAKPEPKRAPARQAPAAEPEAPAPAPARKTGGDPLLDVGGDDDLAKELSGGAKKRSVYVPPAPGSELPERVSDPQIIEAVVGRKPALAACVAEQKASDPSVAGTLMLRWSISPDGAVREVKNLSSEYARQPIVQCISGVVKGTRFPKSRLGRDVEGFPFKF